MREPYPTNPIGYTTSICFHGGRHCVDGVDELKNGWPNMPEPKIFDLDTQ